jgi:hypothetical protein
MSDQTARSVFIDPLIDDVRQRRRDLLAFCGDDLDVLAKLIRRREAEHPERMGDPRPPNATTPAKA